MAIAQFVNGLITKLRLNELVDGINSNTTNIATNTQNIEKMQSKIATNTQNIKEMQSKIVSILSANVTKTVGVGGDFATLKLALDWCKTIVSNGYTVTLSLLVGYEIEPLTYSNVDFGFVTLTSSDGLSRTHVANSGSYNYLFEFFNSNVFSLGGGFKIYGKNNGTGHIGVGLYLYNSNMTFGNQTGLKNFVMSMNINGNSNVICGSLCAFDSSNVKFGGVHISNSDADLSRAIMGNLYATFSRVFLYKCKFTSINTNISVSRGSIVSATDSTGAILSQTENTITANGIIFE